MAATLLQLDPPAVPGHPTGSWRDDGYQTTGTIVSLRAGGFGFITSDTYGRPWALRFHAVGVAGNRFAELVVGERVRFRKVTMPGNPGRAYAVQVSPLA